MKRVVATIVALVIAVQSLAHDPKISGIGVAINGEIATIAVQVHLNNLGAGNLSDQIAKRLHLTINGKPYVPFRPKLSLDEASGVASWKASYDGAIRNLSVEQRLFPEDSASRTFVSITKDNQPLQETIVDAAHPSMVFGGEKKASTWNTVTQFLGLGGMHIFAGPDHILFILGLILMGGGLKSLLKTVTAFTLAHSITLTIAALGVWSPSSRFVEPLIALSIVAVAVENLRRRKDSRDWRPMIAFGFGLIHGFGFAGGLVEAGLPQAAIGWALASFNVGEECAQAAIVLVAAPILAGLAARKPRASYRVIVAGSVAIALAGAFWFAERLSPSLG
jgi:hypothetical protein